MRLDYQQARWIYSSIAELLLLPTIAARVIN